MASIYFPDIPSSFVNAISTPAINAKGVYGKNYNKQDTMHLLNLISIWAGEAAKYSDMICDGMGKARKVESDRIYKLLEENGLYKSLSK